MREAFQIAGGLELQDADAQTTPEGEAEQSAQALLVKAPEHCLDTGLMSIRLCSAVRTAKDFEAESIAHREARRFNCILGASRRRPLAPVIFS